MATYTKESKVRAELTIRRPNGTVETLAWPSDPQLSKVRFEQIRKATKDAGRGEVISYQNITPEYQMTEADKHERDMAHLISNSWVRR